MIVVRPNFFIFLEMPPLESAAREALAPRPHRPPPLLPPLPLLFQVFQVFQVGGHGIFVVKRMFLSRDLFYGRTVALVRGLSHTVLNVERKNTKSQKCVSIKETFINVDKIVVLLLA